MQNKYVFLNRVCVPLTIECDLNCRYCYRNRGRIARVPEFNDLMRDYLAQLDPTRVQAVVASGGEPLLHFEKVLELFSYAPKEIHTRCMTNGLNLTKEMVNYFNDRNTEVFLSHDGDWTEYLRGVDILKDAKQLKIIREIKNLTIGCVCTNKNPDPYKNYLQTKKVLQRDFVLQPNAVFEDDLFPLLTENFDYEAYACGYLHCLIDNILHQVKIKKTTKKKHPTPLRCNVLPNGDVVGMAEINHKYGTVLDSFETLFKRKTELGDVHYCNDLRCEAKCVCGNPHLERITEHSCHVIKCEGIAREISKTIPIMPSTSTEGRNA